MSALCGQATGAKLASVTFSGETASGWQQANFLLPYRDHSKHDICNFVFRPVWRLRHDQYYSWTTLSARPLHVSGSAPGRVYIWLWRPVSEQFVE